MNIKRQATLSLYRKRLLRVLLHIERHLDADIELDELAAIANFSPYHFHRIFSGMVGESVKSYVRRLRLDRAAHRLQFTKERVTDIALNAGYEALEAFSKAFAQKFSQKPRQYRSNIRRQRLSEIKNFINQLPRGELTMQVKIENVPKMKVAFVRQVGPYNACETAWQKLCGCKAVAMTFGPNSKFIGVCYDDPAITAPDKIRYDACVTVPESFSTTEEGIGAQELGGGKYAVTTYVGPYSGLGEIYQELYGHWAPQNGYEPTAEPSFEIYKSDPKTTPPEQLVTEIYMPIK